MESPTLRTRTMNYNQLVYEAALVSNAWQISEGKDKLHYHVSSNSHSHRFIMKL